MGGAKKKSSAQQEKAQTGDSAKVSGKKGKKSGKDKEATSSRAEISVILPEAQADKIVRGAKAITVLELARQAGVKASAANAYLVNATRAGKLRIAGGNSGHRVYAAVSSVSTSPAASEPSSSA